jgi:magnesium-transporting ATPase (P-type)
MISRLFLMLVIMSLTLPFVYAAEDDDKLKPSDIMGNPAESLSPVLGPLKWLTGSVVGIFIVAVILGIFVAAIVASAGAATKNAAMKKEGSGNILFMAGIVLAVVIVVMLVWYLFNNFIL